MYLIIQLLGHTPMDWASLPDGALLVVLCVQTAFYLLCLGGEIRKKMSLATQDYITWVMK